VSWQPPPESHDPSHVAYDAVLGLLLCSCVLVVAALVIYLCSVVRLYRHGDSGHRVPPDDVVDHVTTSTAVTSSGKEVNEEVGAGTGLLKVMGNSSSEGGDAAVTWYGSRDVEVGRPMNVRYVSLRHCARQSSSIESESGAPASQANRRVVTPLVPKRFGFVGWTNTSPAAPPGECAGYQSPSESGTTCEDSARAGMTLTTEASSSISSSSR